MHYMCELLREVASYTHGGGVGVLKFRKFFLKALEFLEHHVEVAVGNRGTVEHVVAVVVAVYFPAECLYAGFGLVGCHA